MRRRVRERGADELERGLRLGLGVEEVRRRAYFGGTRLRPLAEAARHALEHPAANGQVIARRDLALERVDAGYAEAIEVALGEARDESRLLLARIATAGKPRSAHQPPQRGEHGRLRKVRFARALEESVLPRDRFHRVLLLEGGASAIVRANDSVPRSRRRGQSFGRGRPTPRAGAVRIR